MSADLAPRETGPVIDAASSSGPTVAVAFGAGGARGYAHITVIEALDELGIRPVAISGASMGSIMGAAMASGMTGRQIRDYTLETVGRRANVVSRLWSLGPRSMRDALGGLRIGQFNLERILDAFLPAEIPRDFSDLLIPLQVVAADLYAQRQVVCDTGPLRTAIAASSSIPALFMPVRLDGRIMIDGGLADPVPYELLRPKADIVIGVDVVGVPPGDGTVEPNRIESLLAANQLMMQTTIGLKLRLSRPDIFVRPPVGQFRVLDFWRAREILEASEEIKDQLKREIDDKITALARIQPTEA